MSVTLAEYLTQIYEAEAAEETTQEKPQFVINDMDKASWALRKIAQMEAKKKAAMEQAEAESFRISTWLSAQVSDYDREIHRFEQMLRPFAETALAGDKKRSLTLPVGTIGFRKGQPKFEVNEPELLAYVKENAVSYVKIKESVDWSNFKKDMALQADPEGRAITRDGEIVPGVAATPGEDQFYVKVGK